MGNKEKQEIQQNAILIPLRWTCWLNQTLVPQRANPSNAVRTLQFLGVIQLGVETEMNHATLPNACTQCVSRGDFCPVPSAGKLWNAKPWNVTTSMKTSKILPSSPPIWKEKHCANSETKTTTKPIATCSTQSTRFIRGNTILRNLH